MCSDPKGQVAILLYGCFWHRCSRCLIIPATNIWFWEDELSATVVRDRRVRRQQAGSGWKVIRIWEHAIQRLAAAFGG